MGRSGVKRMRMGDVRDVENEFGDVRLVKL